MVIKTHLSYNLIFQNWIFSGRPVRVRIVSSQQQAHVHSLIVECQPHWTNSDVLFPFLQSKCCNILFWRVLQCSSWSWKTTGRTHLHKLIFIVNPRWRRCPTRITTSCTKIAAPFALIGRFLQLQAQNNADQSPKKPKGSRKMTGSWKNDRALRKNDRALHPVV